MIGTLTRYELKKSVWNKFFLIIFALLLLANVLLNCGIQDFLNWMDAVENGTALGEITAENTNFWGNKAEIRRTTARIRKQYATFAELTPEERTAFEAAMKEKYGEEVFEFPIPTDEMMSSPGYFGGETNDFTWILNYSDVLQWNEENRESYESVLRAAKAFGREALEEGDNYGIRRNLQIIRLYSQPRGEITGPVRGWSDFLFDNPAMLLVFLMVLLTCAGNVSGERDRQTWLLLHTAKNGKGKTLTAKYLAGAASAAVLTILFQLASLGAILFRGGLLGFNQPVAALEQLRLFPYTVTVGQYVFLTLACQVFAAVVLSILLTTISALSRSSVISYAVGAIVLGGCLLLVYIPPKTEWLAGPLALSSPLKYFDSYDTANLFGFPVLWAVVQAVLWCALSGVCVWLAQKVYHRKRRVL